MNKIKTFNVCIAGLGTVGSNVIDDLINNHEIIVKKINAEFKILAISAKNKSKKRKPTPQKKKSEKRRISYFIF